MMVLVQLKCPKFEDGPDGDAILGDKYSELALELTLPTSLIVACHMIGSHGKYELSS